MENNNQDHGDIKDNDFWQSSNGSDKNKDAGIWGFIKETAKIIIAALVIALLLQTFIVDSRIVPTLSMYPTIDANDRVIVNKLAYIGARAPERGDIVVFKAPAELNTTEDLLKRVIGLPGETVEVKDGKVFIDEVAIEEDYLNSKPDYTFGPVTVPEGEYLMFGDNRNNSVDSHRWTNHFIAEKDIVGQVLLRYWPLYNIDVF